MRGSAGDRAALQDMIRYIQRILAHSSHGREVLEEELARDGILYEIAIVGEAAGRVTDELRAAHPEVPWRSIVAQRNILMHVYDKLNLDRVWEAVEAVPALKVQIEHILEEFTDLPNTYT